jgi:putative transposase
MFVAAERSLSNLPEVYYKHPVSTEGGTWYPQTCKFLKLDHHINSSYGKRIIIERSLEYIKDRTECFDDYFPCRKKKCKLKHIQNWFNLFVDHYNREVIS